MFVGVAVIIVVINFFRIPQSSLIEADLLKPGHAKESQSKPNQASHLNDHQEGQDDEEDPPTSRRRIRRKN